MFIYLNIHWTYNEVKDTRYELIHDVNLMV